MIVAVENLGCINQETVLLDDKVKYWIDHTDKRLECRVSTAKEPCIYHTIKDVSYSGSWGYCKLYNKDLMDIALPYSQCLEDHKDDILLLEL